MKREFIICCLFLMLTVRLSAQDWTWWANNVKYDNKTYWTEYIIFSPKYMGPNALPVPNFSDGLIENETYFMISGSAHLSKGDNTYNPNIYINYNLIDNLISFDFYYLPIEYFIMSHEIKTERKTFYHYYYDKTARGDMYLNTNIQLIRKQSVDLKVRIGYKFPTSNKVGMARFTDSPGYYFDLNFGIPIINLKDSKVKLTGMVGFYAWQTNSDIQYQNDALLYGLGVSLKQNDVKLETGVRGYWGYMNNGDKPMVWKIQGSKRINNVGFSLGYQLGILDTKYHSFEVGAAYYFNKPKVKQIDKL